jgi:hypothetical protein
VSLDGDQDTKTHTTTKYSLEKCNILIKSRCAPKIAFHTITGASAEGPLHTETTQQKLGDSHHDF